MHVSRNTISVVLNGEGSVCVDTTARMGNATNRDVLWAGSTETNGTVKMILA